MAVLSPDERTRADRLRRPSDRARWTAARAALRQILSCYTGLSPEAVRIIRSDAGKPALTANSPLRFNLTHAGDRAALAVTWEREVGIDLEPIDPELDLPPLLAVACTPAETARITALPATARVEAFLTLWTVKEAYLKATGAGLSREPRTIEIDVRPDGRAIVRDHHLETDFQRWSSCLLEAGPGWVAALAVDGAEPEITVFDWPPDAKNVLAS